MPGALEGVAIGGLTVAFAAFLAASPLVDRRPIVSRWSRWPHFVIAGALATMVLVLTIKPLVEDARDEGLAAQRAGLARDAERAFRLAKKGIPPGGAGDLYLNDPIERGKHLFAVECQACHRLGDKGGDTAPDLTGYMTPAWVLGVTADPTQPKYFGRTTLDAMQPTDATPQQLDTLTAYQMSLGGLAPEPPGGAELFEELGCQTCHARAGEKPRMGPSLAGYGTRAWIVGAIKNPGAPEYYGNQNKMPAFAGKLTDAQLDDIVTYILSGESTTEKSP